MFPVFATKHAAHCCCCVCFCKEDAPVLGPPVQSFVCFVGRMPRFLVGRPIFYKQFCHGASVLGILGHPWASVLRNVGFEGHPFSQKGHPLTRNVVLEGIKRDQLPFLKLKNAAHLTARFGKAIPSLNPAMVKKQF